MSSWSQALGLLVAMAVMAAGCGGSSSSGRPLDAGSDGRGDGLAPDSGGADRAPDVREVGAVDVGSDPDGPSGEDAGAEDAVDDGPSPEVAAEVSAEAAREAPPPDGPDCVSTCTAANVGNACKDNKTVATCAASPQVPGCYLLSNPVACTGVKTCAGVGGAAACVCPAVTAVPTPGAGCASSGTRACGTGMLLTCGSDPAASGCLIWQMIEDCAGQACETVGGAAGCSCGAPTGNDLYVDPVAGGGWAGRAPTGAQQPASCRFKTLGQALAVAPSGRRVVAASNSLPATFSGETFPLVVPAGVTLTTGGATPPPSFKISFAGASAAMAERAISLGDGARLSGFILENGGGSNNAVGLACTTGPATVERVRLTGSSGAAIMRLGVQVGSDSVACQLTASDVTVEGFESGVSVLGQLAATGLVVRGSRFVGLEVEGAAATATLGAGTKLDGNGTGGLRVLDGATVTGTGVSASNNGNASGGLNDGLRVVGGSLTLHQSTIDNNEGRGLFLDSGTVVLDDGSVMRGNGKMNGSSAIRYKGGTLNVGGATGGVVKISDNGRHGVYVWTEEGLGSGAVNIQRTDLSGNANAGLWVDFVPGGGQGFVTVKGGSITGNVIQGVRVERAPIVGGSSAVLLEDVDIASNGASGNDGAGLNIYAVGESSVRLVGSRVRTNRGPGVVVEQTAGTALLAIEGTDVAGNNTGNQHAVGGIDFATPATLTAFRGNKIHGNGGHEVGIAAAPNGGTTWTLGSGACDATSNKIYCYGAGSVGLHVSAPAPIAVNAANTSFSNATPVADSDWRFEGAGGHTVQVTPACAPVTVCD